MKKELVIIRIKKNLDSKKLEEITSLLSKQYNTGLLVLPEFCELVTIPQKDISDSGSINLIPCDDSLNRKTKNEKPKNKITKYRIGDKMSIPLFGFGKFTVTAQKQMGNRTLFLFDRCVIKKAMDSSEIEKNNFEETDLNRWLQNILLPAFPQKIRPPPGPPPIGKKRYENPYPRSKRSKVCPGPGAAGRGIPLSQQIPRKKEPGRPEAE